MDAPRKKHKETYIKEVKEIDERLKNILSDAEDFELELTTLQEQLDAIADEYLEDPTVGKAIYKLYELQARIHYLEGRHNEALEFIGHAIETRGETTQGIEHLREQVIQAPVSDVTTPPGPVGLQGWLAIYIVGLFLSLAITTFNLFNGGFISQYEIDIFNEYQAGLGETMQAVDALESTALFILIGLFVTTLILLFQKKRIAKHFAITTIGLLAAYSLVDYVVVDEIFRSSGLYNEVSEFMEEYMQDVVRNMFYAIIWIPYFLISKRVKATLVK